MFAWRDGRGGRGACRRSRTRSVSCSAFWATTPRARAAAVGRLCEAYDGRPPLCVSTSVRGSGMMSRGMMSKSKERDASRSAPRGPCGGSDAAAVADVASARSSALPSFQSEVVLHANVCSGSQAASQASVLTHHVACASTRGAACVRYTRAEFTRAPYTDRALRHAHRTPQDRTEPPRQSRCCYIRAPP